jgi:hypothetical protein
MPRAFYITPTAPMPQATTVRLGAGNTTNDNMTDKDRNKIVGLVAESRYNLTAAAGEIEGFIVAVEQATAGGFTIGSIITEGRAYVTCDGLQATPGTGTIAVGDYVLAGTATAKGTALTAYAKVVKATTQSGPVFKWRVVSLLTGAGAVGTTAVIEKI